MVFPAVHLHHFHSLNLYDGLDIIFEDLNILDFEVLKRRTIADNIDLVPNILRINTVEKSIFIVGYKINATTYMVNQGGTSVTIPYSCSNDNIIVGIEYLYHMYKNKYVTIDSKVDVWNPKRYRPEE
jgi:hypothetical protein